MSKNFELLRQIGREHDLFQTSAGSRVAKTADCERASLVEIALPRPEPKEARQQIRSPELVKEKAKSWNQEISRKEFPRGLRSEEHTSELQSRLHLVCRLLLEKKKQVRRHSC